MQLTPQNFWSENNPSVVPCFNSSTSQPSGLGMLHLNQQSGSTSNLWQGLPDARTALPDHLSGQATLPRLPPHHMLATASSSATSGGMFSNHLNSLAGTSTNGFNTLNTAHMERGGGTPLSPASVLSNYSLNRNMVNHLNLTNLIPSANK